ncbi:MAG: SRPBCC family protein [Bdellovibrionota bacterium]
MLSKDGTTIIINRAFNTSVEKLFTAWSNPTIFKIWWKEISVAEMDFREGGTYKLQWSESCNSSSEHQTSAIVGTYKKIIPNKTISFTWNGTGDWTATKENLITLTFTAKNDNLSELELKHEFSNSEASRDSHHEGWTWAMLSLDTHFNAPQRRINEELKVHVSKTYSHPVEKVFAAWTDSKSLAKWFNRDGATMGSASTEAKVGTTFHMDYQEESGNVHRLYGTYSEIVPNKKLSFSWVEDSSAERNSPHYGYPTAVTVNFEALAGNKCKVDVTHSKLSSESLAKNFQGGWTSCLNGVEKFLNAKA